MAIAPTLVPAAQLPTGAAVRTLLWAGPQSNNIGASSTYVTPNTQTPHFARWYEQKQGRPGIWERNGAMWGDQFSVQAVYQGSEQQADIDLTAAGKKPIFGSIARSGTGIDYFINGGPGQAQFQAWIAEALSCMGSRVFDNVIMIGGENDANSLATSLTFQAGLTSFFAQNIRPVCPGSRAYIALLNVNYAGPDATWRTNVRNAQTAFVAADGNAELLNCDAFGYVSPHYTFAGYNSIGSLIATRVLIYQP